MGVPTNVLNQQRRILSDERQTRVTRMFLQGMTMNQIGREVGVSTATISRDLMKARESWRKETGKSYEELLPEKLAELDAIRAAAWEGWKRSLRPENTRSSDTSDGPEGSTTRRGRKRKSTAGDPRFLQRLESILRTECQIRGLLDPDVENKTTNVTVNAVEIVINNAAEKEQFDRIYSLEEFQQKTKPA